MGTVDGSRKWYSFLENNLTVYKKCKCIYPLTSQLDLQNLSCRITYAHAQRYMYMDVHCSLVYNTKKGNI